MEHKLLSLLVFGSLSISSFAQQNTTVSGGNASGTGGSVSYSVGQTDYIHTTGTGGGVNLGVQQVYEIENVSGINELSSLVTAVFPNPTNGILSLEIEHSDQEISYVLNDLAGRTLLSNRIQATYSTIDLSSFASGEYLLSISSKSTLFKTIKIVKN